MFHLPSAHSNKKLDPSADRQEAGWTNRLLDGSSIQLCHSEGDRAADNAPFRMQST
jgi:hypothetical protein